MKAGFSSVDITPSLPCPLYGFIARLEPARSVDLPLEARLLYLDDGKRQALVIGLDVLGLSAESADAMVRDAAVAANITEEAVMIGCSHTHAGPMTGPMRGVGAADESYLATLHEKVIAAVVAAKADASDARAAWGQAPLKIGINRRQRDPNKGIVLGINPSGPAPTHVQVLRVTTARRTIALLVYAAHPYCFGGDTAVVSPDFFGHGREMLRQAGIDALYLNGCAGDISPTRPFQGRDAAHDLGAQLARAVQVACDSASPIDDRIAAGAVRFTIPNDDLPDLGSLAPPPLEEDHTVRESERQNAAVAARLRLAWQQWYDDLRSRSALPERAARISLLRVGTRSILLLPGEVFYTTGEAMAQASAVAAYGHGYVGYLPPPQAFLEGGYEVNEAHRYVWWWRPTPRAEAILIEQTREIFNEVVP